MTAEINDGRARTTYVADSEPHMIVVAALATRRNTVIGRRDSYDAMIAKGDFQYMSRADAEFERSECANEISVIEKLINELSTAKEFVIVQPNEDDIEERDAADEQARMMRECRP